MDRDVKPRRRSRSLTEEERKLWRAAMKDAKPLKRVKPDPAEDAPPPSPAAPPESQAVRAAPAAILAPPPRPRAPLEPPPLGPLERRTSQKLARGQIEIEATIDLHGHSQERAHGALLDFVARSRGRGLRCVLVITGKGASPYARHTLHGSTFYEVPERQGVLRSAVPRWLGEAEFRLHVSGFQPAHPKHGGGGAFYLWLRKKR
ncbi:MAG: Smr/MutS family protein [Alphaproteobacteria bacterium]|nr:Smr/MutS family protein [Alphaproteobacteria bacterium]MDX5415716.1 Smr/MutS family protein [Alphaproteobacteria bacterium]MDX5492978.1 Smr/MutS family protein [Alphaproteobacteria bacterium]